MTTYQGLRTDVWSMALPDDWSQKANRADEGSLYFESGDGTKGLYISTWTLGPNDRRSAADVAGAFRANDRRSLDAMHGYRWQILEDGDAEAGGVHAAVTDYFAAAQSYRAVGKILAAPPLVVRASFQDYACGDVEASREYFQPIIDSLQLNKPN
ncbi:hypothetical protein E4K72_19275 [Oxalobacteraceae bacterium OM1]|nr:hypothetical protein E4K72_19275 [Oxalobacteraceae bacterium OM1]